MRLLLMLVLTAGLLAPLWGQYLEGVIRIGEYQAQILCNPLSNKIYTSNYDANSVTIINGATRQVIATRAVPTWPVYLCLNTVSNRVYCLCVYSSRLAIINGVTDSVTRLTIPHGGANRFAYNATSNRLYVGCDDGYVVVVDGSADTVLHELRLGSVPTVNMFWNPATNHLFCGVGQDSLLVVDCRTDEVRARWYVSPFYEWCYSPVTGRVYTGNSNCLWVFSPRGDSILATISGSTAYFCAVPFPNKVYVCGWPGMGWLAVLDGATNVITDTLRLDYGGAMVCDTVRGKVYTVYGRVSVLDARADTVLATIPLPAFDPEALCWNPLDGRVYVADKGGDSVYVFRDTTSGVAEAGRTGRRQVAATVVRRSYSWPGPGVGQVLDVTGRKVADVRPGVNDIGRLPAGVYTVVCTRTGATAKLVKLR
jgi:YVTN family beta-propeller protein